MEIIYKNISEIVLAIFVLVLLVNLSMEANLRFWVVTPPWEATHLSASREPLYNNELAKVQSASANFTWPR